MTRKPTSLYLDDDIIRKRAEDREFCEQFKQWLARFYGRKHGSIRRFCDDMGLARPGVYCQLNGTVLLTEELRQTMIDCMARWKAK